VSAQTHEHTRLQQLAELKRLTLPGEMGEKFKLMALARGDHPALHGFCGSMLP
jgi:SAM-dependent MidA family methyltransferase